MKYKMKIHGNIKYIHILYCTLENTHSHWQRLNIDQCHLWGKYDRGNQKKVRKFDEKRKYEGEMQGKGKNKCKKVTKR
jgi:hypothetical protein